MVVSQSIFGDPLTGSCTGIELVGSGDTFIFRNWRINGMWKHIRDLCSWTSSQRGRQESQADCGDLRQPVANVVDMTAESETTCRNVMSSLTRLGYSWMSLIMLQSLQDYDAGQFVLHRIQVSLGISKSYSPEVRVESAAYQRRH